MSVLSLHAPLPTYVYVASFVGTEDVLKVTRDSMMLPHGSYTRWWARSRARCAEAPYLWEGRARKIVGVYLHAEF